MFETEIVVVQTPSPDDVTPASVISFSPNIASTSLLLEESRPTASELSSGEKK
jgi:hypothetical protein